MLHHIFYNTCLTLGGIGFILAAINLWFLVSDTHGWIRARIERWEDKQRKVGYAKNSE